MPPEFVRNADVELCVSGKRLPAHSQFLASQLRFMAMMFEDLAVSSSKADKFVVSEETLERFTAEGIMRFLVHCTTSATSLSSQPQRRTNCSWWQSSLTLQN